MKKETISILGCGWFGFPLAKRWLEKGYHVRGSRRSVSGLQELREAGMDAFQIDTDTLLNEPDTSPFWSSRTLLINIPPGRRQGDVLTRHPKEVAQIMDRAAAGEVHRIIFVSSTSVYDQRDGVVREDDLYQGDASRDSGRALRQIEQTLRQQNRFEWMIVRPGGLYGYNRHPANYLAGKSDLAGGSRPVNLVHRDDLVRAVDLLLEKSLFGEDFNVVADCHPTRSVFYTAMAKQHGLEPPRFSSEGPDNSESSGKIVSNEKLKEKTGFQFLYPDPADPAP